MKSFIKENPGKHTTEDGDSQHQPILQGQLITYNDLPDLWPFAQNPTSALKLYAPDFTDAHHTRVKFVCPILATIFNRRR